MTTNTRITATGLTACMGLALLLGALSGGGPHEAVASPPGKPGAKPSIEFTTVPPRGAGPERMEAIAGIVKRANLARCKVVIFAKTDTWYVQPTVAEPDTFIDRKGRWETATHLGWEYAALLVDESYDAPATTASLPSVGDKVLAVVRARATRQ